jgi:putative endopeptidase
MAFKSSLSLATAAAILMPYSPSLDVNDLDRSVDPCVDFYKFSCGGWEKEQSHSRRSGLMERLRQAGNENQQFLWGILADDAKAQNRTPCSKRSATTLPPA